MVIQPREEITLRTQEYDWAPETADGCNGGLLSGAATEAESNVL
jgi:hypothetical protein